MVTPIVRDIDIITNTGQGVAEPDNFASTGLAIESAGVVDANDDLSNAVAALGPQSVVDGSAGVISEGDMTILSSGQVVMGGGGSTLDVVGRNSGTPALVPGHK